MLIAAAALGAGCAPRDEARLARRSAAGRRPAEAPARIPIVTDCPDMPVKTRDGLLRATPAPAGRALDDARSILEEQIALYPARFLRLIALEEVVLCDTLSFEGTDCGAFADVERGRIYLRLGQTFRPAWLRRTIHHETFHQVDYADDHRLDADPRWEALTPPGFRYTQDSLRVQADPDAMVPDRALPGFINRYATTSVAEDKAEMFGLMMTDPALVEARAADDPVIRGKAGRIRTMLNRLGPTGQMVLRPWN